MKRLITLATVLLVGLASVQAAQTDDQQKKKKKKQAQTTRRRHPRQRKAGRKPAIGASARRRLSRMLARKLPARRPVRSMSPRSQAAISR